jgi:WD40 repeat protein
MEVIEFHRAEADETLVSLSGHPSMVGELLFSPDGTLLASTDWVDLRIWRVEDATLLYVGKTACPCGMQRCEFNYRKPPPIER